MKNDNLKSWQPGISGNPKGRPKGSRNIKKVIQDMLDDPNVYQRLPRNSSRDAETPLEAILCTLMMKAMRGDIRAADVLLKYSVDRNIVVQSDGFFSQNELRITVVGTDGNPHSDSLLEIDSETGTLIEAIPSPRR